MLETQATERLYKDAPTSILMIILYLIFDPLTSPINLWNYSIVDHLKVSKMIILKR